jgi:hypothetical protein
MMGNLSKDTVKTIIHDFNSSGIEYSINPRDSKALLELNGDLRVGWTASLAASLTRLDINIIRGKALKESALWWRSSFEIEPAGPCPEDFTKLDVESFFKGPVNHAAIPAITLSDFHLELCSRHCGSLDVAITGVDSIGFLAGILRQFGFYSLFPVEMEIDTKGNMACDRFWLKCIGNVTPLAEDAECVRNRLTGLVGV